jgi:hypothetical protein
MPLPSEENPEDLPEEGAVWFSAMQRWLGPAESAEAQAEPPELPAELPERNDFTAWWLIG